MLAALIGAVQEGGEDGIRLPELFDDAVVGGRWSVKTVENAVRDLAAFGALRIVQRGRDRCATMTVLGVAWLEGVTLPALSDDMAELREAMAELFE